MGSSSSGQPTRLFEQQLRSASRTALRFKTRSEEMEMKVTFQEGDLKRYCVPVRCTSHPDIWTPEPGVYVFAGDEAGAREAAVEKMQDKYLRHQSTTTEWEVTGDPVEN
jgi:hypothetical protein